MKELELTKMLFIYESTVGDFDKEDELYIEGKKAFKKMLKYVIGEY